MFDLYIKNAVIITVDPAHRVYQPGYLLVKGTDIAALGPMEELKDDPQAKQVIDADGMALLPGLVDGHGHAGHCLIRNFADPDPGWDRLIETLYFRYTDEFFWYAEAALAAAERIKFGVTTGVSMLASTPRCDSPDLLAAHFDGAGKTGLRQLSGFGFCDGPWPKHPRMRKGSEWVETDLTPEQAAANTEEAVRRFNGVSSRQICLVAPGNITPRPEDSPAFAAWKNREMARIAREYHVPLHTHARTGGIQFAWDTTPELFGPTTTLTHSTGLTDSEIRIVADSGAVILHGPTTRANIMQRCPVYEILRAGGEVVIVTDGTAPDRSYDLWRDMKIFQVIHRLHENNDLLAPPGRVLEMCTIRAARAFGLDGITGSLEAGKRADLILVDTKQPHLAPFHILPEARLVHFAQGQDVDTVIVEGEVVMAHRKLLRCDEAQILADAEKAQEELFSRLEPEMLQRLLRFDGMYELEATVPASGH